jgi:hypothetical protein
MPNPTTDFVRHPWSHAYISGRFGTHPAVPSQLVLNDTLRVFDPPLHISLVVERCAETVTASRSASYRSH